MLEYRDSIDSFWELEDKVWSGAKYTLNTIREFHMEDELMMLLEEVFSNGEIPTMTAINDFLWFEDEFIFTTLGCIEDGDEEEDEEEDEE